MGEESEMVYLLCPNYATILCDGIKHLYEKKELTDIVVSLDGRDTFVHTFMVALFIPKIIATSENNRCDLSGINIDQETLCSLLDFIYKGQIKVARDKLKSLKKGAGKVGLKLLVDVIDKEIKSNNLKRKATSTHIDPKKIKVTEVDYVIEGQVENFIVDDESAAIPESQVEKSVKSQLKCPRCEFHTTEIEVYKRHLLEIHQANVEEKGLRIRFKCGDCEHVADSQKEMATHRKQKHKKKLGIHSFKCTRCDFKAEKKGLLRRHLRYSHSTTKPFKCAEKDCDYQGRTEKELNVHMDKQHDGKTHKCELCDKDFEGRYLYNNHLKLVHTEPDQRHTCQFCDFKTRYMIDLKRHLSEKHNYRQPRIQKRKVYTEADLKQCPRCDIKLKNRPLLIDHLAYHHQVDIDGNPIEPKLKCKMCDYVCWAHFQLHNHVYQNHTEKQFRCEHCDYACRRRRALTAHVLGKHFGQKAFMCELCGQCFSYNATLKRHLQLHESGTAFTCDSCGKIFTQKVYLDSHVKNVHTESSNRFQCDLCSYSATTKGNLVKHIKRKHKNETDVVESEELVTEMEVNDGSELLIQEPVLEEIVIF